MRLCLELCVTDLLAFIDLFTIFPIIFGFILYSILLAFIGSPLKHEVYVDKIDMSLIGFVGLPVFNTLDTHVIVVIVPLLFMTRFVLLVVPMLCF